MGFMDGNDRQEQVNQTSLHTSSVYVSIIIALFSLLHITRPAQLHFYTLLRP